MKQIQSILNELKLLGMAHALESVSQQASVDGLHFQEALLLLLQHEKQSRVEKKSHSLEKKASFRNGSRLENWDSSFERGLTRSKIRELSSISFFDNKSNLLIMGQTGSGKTQFAIALGRIACQKCLTVSFMSMNKFFEEYQISKTREKHLHWIQSISKINILVFDDFALRKYTHSEASILLDVLEERYQKGVLIITSQIDTHGWHLLFEDAPIAEAIVDRILNPSTKIVLSGGSYRARLSPKVDHPIAQEGKKL